MTGHRGSLLHADVTADLTPASLSVPIVNLEKTPGQPASGRFGINFAAGNVVQEETIRISGPVLNLNGTADFDRNGDLTVLNFPSVQDGAAERSFLPARARPERRRLSGARPFAGRFQDRPHRLQRGAGRRCAAAGPDDTFAGRIPYRRQAGPAGDARWRFHCAVQSGAQRHRRPAGALGLSGNITQGRAARRWRQPRKYRQGAQGDGDQRRCGPVGAGPVRVSKACAAANWPRPSTCRARRPIRPIPTRRPISPARWR